MYGYMQLDAFDCFTVDNLNYFLFLFADDTVLFSYSEEGLQFLLNDNTNQWVGSGTVNTVKTCFSQTYASFVKAVSFGLFSV